MLETLPANEDTIAIRVSGRLERAEIDALLDRLEARLDEGAKTHLYVEVEEGAGGFGLEGLPDQLRRAGALLGKLEHLGRVAVVSDERWVRGAARLESALLPYVRYEIFRSAERDQALAWVRGERGRPRDPALLIIETDRPDVVGFELDGRLSAEEAAAAADYFGALIERRRPLRMLARVRRFDGLELSALADRDFTAMKRGALKYLERYAVVGGPAWLPAWVSALDSLLIPEIRHFEDERRAWAWLEAEPVAERPILERRAPELREHHETG